MYVSTKDKILSELHCSEEELKLLLLDSKVHAYKPGMEKGCRVVYLLLDHYSYAEVAATYSLTSQAVKNLVGETVRSLKAYRTDQKIRASKSRMGGQAAVVRDERYKSYLALLTRMCTFRDTDKLKVIYRRPTE